MRGRHRRRQPGSPPVCSAGAMWSERGAGRGWGEPADRRSSGAGHQGSRAAGSGTTTSGHCSTPDGPTGICSTPSPHREIRRAAYVPFALADAEPWRIDATRGPPPVLRRQVPVTRASDVAHDLGELRRRSRTASVQCLAPLASVGGVMGSALSTFGCSAVGSSRSSDAAMSAALRISRSGMAS